MASNYTSNYQLCQWEGTDKVLRTDFNSDNAKIDAALKANADAVSAEAEARAAAVSSEASARAAADAALTASIPKVKVGTYTGDGGDSKTISVGFTPKAVLVLTREGQTITGTGIQFIHGGLAVTGGSVVYDGDTVLQIVSGGFTVHYKSLSGYVVNSNYNGTVFRYLAIG